MGLLALMLLNESRHQSRVNEAGDIVLLEDQDRSLWKQDFIREGSALVQRAIETRDFGAYTLQAAISAVHAEAKSSAETDWAQIAALYDLLARASASPVVDLNRAVAIAMRDGPAAGLPLIDELLKKGELNGYHLAHAARADLCRRLGLKEEARKSYRTALELSKQEPERRFLDKRLKELG
jgi:RNA polymerase sigma-70 factor (ECF subfamily)